MNSLLTVGALHIFSSLPYVFGIPGIVFYGVESEIRRNLRLQAQESELRDGICFPPLSGQLHQLFNIFMILYSRLLDKAPEEARIMLLISDMMKYF